MFHSLKFMIDKLFCVFVSKLEPVIHASTCYTFRFLQKHNFVKFVGFPLSFFVSLPEFMIGAKLFCMLILKVRSVTCAIYLNNLYFTLLFFIILFKLHS